MADRSNKKTFLDTLPEDDEGDQFSFDQNQNLYQYQWYQQQEQGNQLCDQEFYDDQDEIQRIQEVYPSEYQEHQNYLTYDSRLTFENEIRRQQFQHQTDPNSQNSLVCITKEEQPSDEIQKLLSQRYSQQRDRKSTSPDNQPQPITEEPSEDSLGKSLLEEQLNSHRMRLGEKKSPLKQSLIGTLFTPSILKEIQMLNEMRLFTEQGRTPGGQTQSVDIENGSIPAFNFQQTPSYQTQQTQQFDHDEQKSNRSEEISQQHSVLKINILREITINLQNDEEQQQLLEERETEFRINPILLSKTPEILDFIMTLGKELIGKQALTKAMKEKILQKNKEIQFLLKKNKVNSNIQTKTNQITDDQIAPAQKVLAKLSNFFIPAFIQSLNLECLKTDTWFRIFSTLSVMFAIGYEDFKLINNKIPKINKDTIILLLRNPSNLCSSIKNISKSLLQRPLQKDVFFEFQKQFILLDKIVELNEAHELKDENAFLMLKMIYSAKYYLDCLGDMDKLQFIQDPSPLLNYDINKLYEQHIWQPRGTRYGSAKNSDEIRQAEMKNIFEKYGIDFMSWELNLKIQEEEIKQVKRAEKELEWKDRKNQKQILQLRNQKENALELEANQEKFLISQAVKEQNHQKKAVEKQLKLQEQTSLLKTLKKGKNEKEKEIILHERQIQEEQKNFSSTVQAFKKNKKKLLQEEQKQNIIEKKEKLQQQKVTDLEKEEEEKVWRRAQEMLERQKKLLKQKEDILKRIQVFEQSKLV